MRPANAIALGLLLGVGGLFFGLLFTGVLLIADCTAQCVANHERWVAGGLAALGYAVLLAGIALVVATQRRMRAAGPPVDLPRPTSKRRRP